VRIVNWLMSHWPKDKEWTLPYFALEGATKGEKELER